MKDLGKTIAKYRKEHKLNQSQLAKELENYDIYVKQNSISAWELGTATPNARQFLALCEILEIYDIYTDFIGQSPLNPFRNLNENGMNKVLEYISKLPEKQRRVFNYETQIAKLESEIQRFRDLKLNLYSDMADGIITREEYKEFGAGYDRKIAERQRSLAVINDLKP